MLKSLKMKYVWIWLTALAVLLSAIAPTISHASRAVRGVDLEYVSICTTSGMKWLDVKTGEISDQAPASSEVVNQADRCDCCLTKPLALSPKLFDDIQVVSVTRSDMPFLFYHAPEKLHAWSQSNPRAPPVI